MENIKTERAILRSAYRPAALLALVLGLLSSSLLATSRSGHAQFEDVIARVRPAVVLIHARHGPAFSPAATAA